MIAIACHVAFAVSVVLGPSIESSVENKVLVVRHGGGEQSSVQAVAFNRTSVQSVAPVSDTGRVEAVKALNELADLGLITIRAIRTDTQPSWTYKPKTFHGHHPKPQWTYHGRAGWLYDETTGWRYRREPDWAQRPGAVNQLLKQLPAVGETWYVTRWR